MKKIYYTRGKFTEAAQQVMMYPINMANDPVESCQKDVEKAFPELCEVKNNIMDNAMKAEPAEMGDIIWTASSGGKHIGHAIIQEQEDNAINLDALKACCKSVEKKALSLGQKAVAIPMISPSECLEDWNSVYPVIEEAFEKIDVVVYIPDQDLLFEVLRSIGGDIDEHTVTFYNGPIDTPFIRFR